MTGDMLQHITFNIILIQTAFIESALIALYLHSQNGKSIYYFLSLLMVFLAVFSQEITLLFPLYAISLLFFLSDLKIKEIIKLTVPFVLFSLLLIAIWLFIINPSVHLERIKIVHPGNFLVSCANFSHVFFWYLSNILFPRDIEFMANMPFLINFIWLWNSLLFIFLLGYVFLIVCYYKRSLESFALVLFIIGFIYAVPTSQTRPSMG